MSKQLVLIYINYFLLFEITHAQYSDRRYPQVSPTLSANIPKSQPTPVPTKPTSDRIPAKCYPETATAYFLPAPPTAPKVTVLKCPKDIPPNFNQREKPISLIQEVPQSTPRPIVNPNPMTSRATFPPPPPPCSTGLPDLMDEVPSKIQDRFSRLAETEEKAPVCESCAALIKKLPIFNFDQELLNGFLAGLGL